MRSRPFSRFFLSIRAATLRFLVPYDDNDNPLKMSGATTVILSLAYKIVYKDTRLTPQILAWKVWNISSLVQHLCREEH